MNIKKMWYKDKLVNFIKQSGEVEQYAIVEFDGILEHVLLEDLAPCAEDMFEDLGYRLNKELTKLDYLVYTSSRNITFVNSRKCVYGVSEILNVNMHNAIHQQMKELDWINQ